jgi:hypothetical protein
MSTPPPVRRQILDRRAALWAGLIAGVVFFVLLCALTAVMVGSPWVFPRLLAASILGKGVLPPPATFDAGVLLAALGVHLPFSVIFAALIAFVIHRGGMLGGILGGAALGLALYAINFGVLSAFAPWMTILTGWIGAVTHIAFGAVAGGVYEALEVERFEVLHAQAPVAGRP